MHNAPSSRQMNAPLGGSLPPCRVASIAVVGTRPAAMSSTVRAAPSGISRPTMTAGPFGRSRRMTPAPFSATAPGRRKTNSEGWARRASTTRTTTGAASKSRETSSNGSGTPTARTSPADNLGRHPAPRAAAARLADQHVPVRGLRLLGWGAALEDQGETGGCETVPHLPGREPVPVEVDAETADSAAGTVAVAGRWSWLYGSSRTTAVSRESQLSSSGRL